MRVDAANYKFLAETAQVSQGGPAAIAIHCHQITTLKTESCHDANFDATGRSQVPPVPTKLASRQLSVFNEWQSLSEWEKMLHIQDVISPCLKTIPGQI